MQYQKFSTSDGDRIVVTQPSGTGDYLYVCRPSGSAKSFGDWSSNNPTWDAQVALYVEREAREFAIGFKHQRLIRAQSESGVPFADGQIEALLADQAAEIAAVWAGYEDEILGLFAERSIPLREMREMAFSASY